MSKQRLAGLCGPRHTWDESKQEKSRSIYSQATSEYDAYRSSFYHDGVGVGGDVGLDYGGDELAWEWREATRLRVQDAFEFCLTSGRKNSGIASAGLRWSAVSSDIAYGGYGHRNRRHMGRHRQQRSAKGKEPSHEKSEFGAENRSPSDEGFEGIEKVLAAVGFPSAASPSRRGILSEDLFAAPASSVLATKREAQPIIEPLRFHREEPGPSTGIFTGLEAPKMAKRRSKDKVPGSSTAPLLNLPYPFAKPGTGQVSSNDMILFPVGGNTKSASKKSESSGSAKSSKSGTSKSKSTSSGSDSVSGSGSKEEEEDDEDEDDEDDEDEEEDEFDSEEPSAASGSMSSLGHPINSPARYPFGVRRPGVTSHARSPSGLSSGMSSGAGISGGSHAHSHSLSSSHGTKSVMGVSVLSQSTGNKESTDSESGAVDGRSLSQGSSPLSSFPMPPRHPHPQGQGRGRSETSPSSMAAAALAGNTLHTIPIAFPTVHQQRRRVDSGRGTTVDPAMLYGSDIEGQHELNDDDLDELPDDDDIPMVENGNQDEHGEHEDRVGLLGVPSNPLASHSRTSLSASHSSSSGSQEARSRTHSSFSVHSTRSRHSSTRARSRSRTHSTKGPSVRERASSLGTSMRSLMQSTASSLTQLDLIMRGATGPAAGLGIGSRPRSRVNSSMAKLEEDVVFSGTEMNERRVSGGSSGNESHNGSAEVALSPIVGRIRQEVEEGYSSGGTHSRSGSESINAENYTFGRPVMFMRPVQEQQPQQQDLVEADEEEIVLVERSRRGSPNRSDPTLSIPVVMDEGEPEPESASTTTSYYSQAPSESTASPGHGTPIPVPIRHSLSASSFNSGDHSPERQGLAIPWNHQQQRLLSPPVQRWERPSHDAATTSGSSGSPPGISTAAQSFVTAAPTMESNTTSTDSSGRLTLSSSWEGGAAIGGIRLSEAGGMVERPGQDMGAGAGGWRVV